MIKIIKYFFQSIIIYLFFISIKIMGLELSRKKFSYIFKKLGPHLKSKEVIKKNLDKFIGPYNENKKEKIKEEMWSNYGKTFVEYLFIQGDFYTFLVLFILTKMFIVFLLLTF